MADPDNVESVDAQLKNLRSSISDLAYQVDSYKTKTAAALGGGVFLLFIAALAAYDLIAGKGGAWLLVGITRETLLWIAGGFGIAAMLLLLVGYRRVARSDTAVRTKLDLLEREYEELLEHRDAGARSDS